jgi:hypothetical protein
MQTRLSRRTFGALALSLATGAATARTATPVEGDWVGEDDRGRAVRVTIARGRVLFLGLQNRALVDTTREGLNRPATHVAFSADGRAISFDFAGGRFAAHRNGEKLDGALHEKGDATTFSLRLI